MKPYYSDDLVTLYHGDCREILPAMEADEFDAVFADPPYGVGKAEWDQRFKTDWMDAAARVAPTVAVTPGVWNVLACPPSIGGAEYRWTLAAHLRNGRGRGALGRGNWIPCLVYVRGEEVKWTASFREWCETQAVTKAALSEATETTDMAGWWTSGLAHRAQVPTPEHWARIRSRWQTPADLDELVYAASPVLQGVDSASFVVATEPMQRHPSPKPLDVMRWFLSRLPGYRLRRRGVLDPFAGSGTTLVAAKEDGRRAVGIEIEERYCELAAQRLSQDVLDFGGAA